MNKKLLWTLLVLAAVVILCLALLLPRLNGGAKSGQDGSASPEPTATLDPGPAAETEIGSEPEDLAENGEQAEEEGEDGELPVDASIEESDGSVAPAQPTSDAQETGSDQESEARTDPETGMDLDEDEVPLDVSP